MFSTVPKGKPESMEMNRRVTQRTVGLTTEMIGKKILWKGQFTESQSF